MYESYVKSFLKHEDTLKRPTRTSLENVASYHFVQSSNDVITVEVTAIFEVVL